MSLWIDKKYLKLVSPRLRNAKWKDDKLFNHSCTYCGDSSKNELKARGYHFQHKDTYVYKCHNCGHSTNIGIFLKDHDDMLYKQWVMEKFGKKNDTRPVAQQNMTFEPPKFKPKLDLPKASDNQIAKQYLEKRNINPSKFYYTDTFKRWVNTLVTKFDDVTYDEPRIIIPLIYENQLIGIQGRSLGPNSVKYITIMLDEDAPKIYGLDEVDTEKPIYILEGPFDSSFVENSVAMCGSDLDIGSFGWSDHIWVFDNEPRNREINNRISKVIDRGDKVVIWPQNIEEKDINDMILGGHDVKNVLESNTFSGLQAKLKFNTWKKI